MKFHDMIDKTDDAGGPGYRTIAIRRVAANHPTAPGATVPAYEVELELDFMEALALTNGGRVRLCFLSKHVVPMHAEVIRADGSALPPQPKPVVTATASAPADDIVDPVRPIICNCGKPRAASDVSWGHGIAYCSECLPY